MCTGRAWLVIAAMALLTACDSTSPADSATAALQAARARWAVVDVTSYAYRVERNCFCLPEARGPVDVTVLDGVVSHRSYTDSGEEPDGEYSELFPPVSGLFDFIDAAIAAGAERIEVTYDPDTGVPIEIWVDYEEMMADEEVGYHVLVMPGDV